MVSLKIDIFFLSGFSFTNIHKSQDCREGGGHFFNSSILLPPASETLRHQLGNYYRELTSAHSQQLDSNQEPLISERKSLTIRLCALKIVTSLNWVLVSKSQHESIKHHNQGCSEDTSSVSFQILIQSEIQPRYLNCVIPNTNN